MTIPIQQIAELRLADLFTTKKISVSQIWTKATDDLAPEFFLATTPTRLLFGGRVSQAAWARADGIGTCVRGLWERDVLELFLVDGNGQRYQEFNLSPTGAWWTMLFQARRGEDASGLKTPRRVEIFSRLGQSAWEAAIGLPISEVMIPITGNGARANVCAILGEKRSYFSFASLGGTTPDFHQPAAFPLIEFVTEKE